MWMNKCEKRKEEKISILQKKKERKKSKLSYRTDKCFMCDYIAIVHVL